MYMYVTIYTILHKFGTNGNGHWVEAHSTSSAEPPWYHPVPLRTARSSRVVRLIVKLLVYRLTEEALLRKVKIAMTSLRLEIFRNPKKSTFLSS
ncbi:hypothetical protein M0802_009071 [Mischocyttarus mexicanus]|nr:hypothetical protein M0802_009071 [Mischocyttarus mexicanus]